MKLQTIIKTLLSEGKDSCKGMAAPKKKRSKSNVRKRLANWKNKGVKVAQRAFNAAKTALSGNKKEKVVDPVEVIEPTEVTVGKEEDKD